MQVIETDILPSRTRFAKIKGPDEVNLEAICVFVALGFFLDSDTYWKNQVCLAPASIHKLDYHGYLLNSESYFEWYYKPQKINFDEAVEQYETLLRAITKSQVKDSTVILPLSGGLDSRSQALIFKGLENQIDAFSYSFENGFKEHLISNQVAENCGFNFESYAIKEGYLWGSIEELAQLNKCYSEFTHPRQMAVLDQLKQKEGVFSLGHWGDVFFDRGVPEGTKESDIMPILFKKMLKPDGLKLAEQLWQYWNLEGNFRDYLTARIETILNKIKIDNLSAKVRAFKTSQWAHRWTTTNLSIFEAVHPITLPYYDNRMCEFICTVPEEFLADRRLQLAHLKQDKVLSNITWQDQNPFNINNYQYNKLPYNLPFRVVSKLKRTLNGLIGNPYIQRNFELQFLGEKNDRELQARIFDNAFSEFIPKSIIQSCYSNFKTADYVNNAHAVSMLLTLSLWHKHFYNLKK